MTIPSEVLKICKCCGVEKATSAFYSRGGGRWTNNTCKSCAVAKNAARRNGPNRAAVLSAENANARKVRRKVRDQVFAAYGGYRCVCCGETQPKFLTLDHVNNDGGEFRRRELGARTHAGYHTYRWLLRNGCPPGVQVLCMNCQHGKLVNGGTCPHQETCNDYPAREYGQAAGSASPPQGVKI